MIQIFNRVKFIINFEIKTLGLELHEHGASEIDDDMRLDSYLDDDCECKETKRDV